MFARVSTYEGGNLPDQDASLLFLQEHVIPAARGMAGWKGAYFLADPSSSKTLSITLWESEDQMRASEGAANKLRAEGNRQAGSQTAKIERFEVVIARADGLVDEAGAGTCARLSRYQIPADKVDVAIRAQAGDGATQVRQIPGNTGAYLLIDRQSGAALSITLWENESALNASKEAANETQARLAASVNATILGVEPYVISATAGEHEPVHSKA